MAIVAAIDVSDLTEQDLEIIEASYGYIYQTTCSCGKLYIGLSKVTNRSGIFRYLGSGSRLKSHLKSHPEHSQTKTILETCVSYDDLERREVELIREAVELHGSIMVLNRKLYPQGSQCAECESFGAHLSSCSLIAPDHACDECGGQRYHHFKDCSDYRKPEIACDECEARTQRHRKGCSNWRPKEPCDHCGSTEKFHLDSCVLKIKKQSCEECGTPNLGAHRKKCSLYIPLPGCSECGSRNSGAHLKFCSQWIALRPCDECGSLRRHKRGCSKQIPFEVCDECGSKTTHRSNCSKHIPPKECEECGSKSSSIHRKTCSLSRKCAECGSAARHRLKCSKSKKSKDHRS